MSSKQYREAFSNVRPSDEAIERILTMTERKHSVKFSRVIIVAAAIISIICSFGLIANAATDGAIADTVSEAIEAVSNKFTVLVNGKETEAEVNVSEKTNADGETHYEAEVKVDLPDNDGYIKAQFEVDADDTDSAVRENLEGIIINSKTE